MWNPQDYEERWRARWESDGLWRFDAARGEHFYNLVEFPYPSAEGLHVGHARTYSGADAHGRYRRMRGREVFQPMGFDSFGINAENYALKAGEHPVHLIARTIARYRGQLERLGAGWDWSRAVVTSDPEYYRWTQWLFLRLLDAGLAYRAEAPVVWCPSCLTVLAFEQLEGSSCERCGTEVVQRVMRQWFLRITAYADALDAGLDELDWPAWAKRQQREWIGRSDGVDIDFRVEGSDDVLTTFTTRPETLTGVTFLAIASPRPVADRFGRTTAGRATGRHAIHPLTGARLPIYEADYVVASYGTAAVMGVPAEDDRDAEFSRAHGLPLVEVTPFDARGVGRPVTRYRLRDWLISRQRYWGPPIPVVHCDACGVVGVPDDQLPVVLPFVEDFRPTGTGESPLASVDSFVRVACPRCGCDARRETDVSDTFVDSSWYFLRYPCTDLADAPWATERVWPVDQYEGGREHVTRHHLYARFMCHALYDLGLIGFREPFPRILYHGLVVHQGAKMSKSRGNVVTPDEYVDRAGADALRVALLFAGPWETGGDFTDEGVHGAVRFLQRAWRVVLSDAPDGAGSGLKPLHRAIDRVGRDLESYRFNTAIAALMELVRWAGSARPLMSAEEWEQVSRTIVLLMAPIAPHIAEELWSRIGGSYSVHREPWPEADPDALRDDEVPVVIEVNGERADVVVVPAGSGEDVVRELAMRSENVQRRIGSRAVRRVVWVPDRVLNFVV